MKLTLFVTLTRPTPDEALMYTVWRGDDGTLCDNEAPHATPDDTTTAAARELYNCLFIAGALSVRVEPRLLAFSFRSFDEFNLRFARNCIIRCVLRTDTTVQRSGDIQFVYSRRVDQPQHQPTT